MRLLLDTCAIIWAATDPDRLSPSAREALLRPDSIISVSVISCAEIACLAQRQRITLTQHWKPWFQQCLALNGWQCMDVTLNEIMESYSLPDQFHADPADRFITATARVHALQLVTADQKLLSYPHVDTLW